MIHILELFLELLWESSITWSCDPQSSREVLKQRSGNFMKGEKIKLLLQESTCENMQDFKGRFVPVNTPALSTS